MWVWEGSCAISRGNRYELSLEATLTSAAKEASSIAERVRSACWPVMYRDQNSDIVVYCNQAFRASARLKEANGLGNTCAVAESV